ncbi:NUMOD4 motif-containing HNH endonuclease [Reichenbachiella carrageenanivorans]|uniref:NUMOD4 motif-containing HNH endonuclease n=1 Tax=Reichenbachiella carrageenanivorans TaxID=2979869 RepID=A0ABY6D3B9_9BACT|nr:NUMOD4 motif-containing HNH endonuclease [Reichenbachiella carrageenanivorans]UXX80269.1 NUMOD4 motif-containing HNH endonuclease [Reichenbachiella carrageenanivorans]
MEAHKIERMEEVWKTISGFSNYEVSNLGRVRRKARKTFHAGSKKEISLKEKVMKQRWNTTCKCFFMDLLNDEGKRKTVYPHREVAEAFCINVLPEVYTMIVHLDNDPKNNDSTNLEWVSPSEHMAFQFEVGNKNNFKVWHTRKEKYKNGFKESTTFKGRPRKTA